MKKLKIAYHQYGMAFILVEKILEWIDALISFFQDNPVITIVTFFFGTIGFITSIMKIWEFMSRRKKAEQERIVYDYALKQIKEQRELEKLKEGQKAISKILEEKEEKVRELEAKRELVISSLEAQPRFMELRMMENQRDSLKKEILVKYNELEEIEKKLATQPSLPSELRKALERSIIEPYSVSRRKENIKTYIIILSYIFGFIRIWLGILLFPSILIDLAFSVVSGFLILRFLSLEFLSRRLTEMKYVGYLLPFLFQNKVWIGITIWKRRKVSILAKSSSSKTSSEFRGYRYELVPPKQVKGKVLLIHKPSTIAKERVIQVINKINLTPNKINTLREIITTTDNGFLDKILENLQSSTKKNPVRVHEELSTISMENDMKFIGKFYHELSQFGDDWGFFSDYPPVALIQK